MRDTPRVRSDLHPPTFVGRAAELAVLDDLFGNLTDRGAATALIAGEAGMGKSRLAGELARRAEHGGALVAVGRTPAAGASLPYGAVVALLRDLARKIDGDVGADRLADAQRLLLGDDDVHEPGPFARLRLFEGVLEAIDNLAGSRPLVLVLEDLHWADAGSIELFDHLVRSTDVQPVLLAATYRAGDLTPTSRAARILTELRSHPAVSPIDLAGLSPAEVSELLMLTTGSPPPWTVVDAIHRRSEGNPFFAEELAVVQDERTLPPALRDLLRLRLGQLSGDARRLVHAAAILGTSADGAVVAAVADLGPRLDDALAEAVDRGVLVHEPAAELVRFRHALLREVALDELLPAERTRLHARAADALAADPSVSAAGPGHAAAVLAEHLHGAGEWARACPAWIAAADASVALYSVHAATVQLTAALDAHRRANGACEHPDVDDAELLRRVADSAYWSADIETAARHAADALGLLDRDAPPERLVAITSVLARSAANNGDDETAFAVIDDLRTALAAQPDSAAHAQAVCLEGRILMGAGRAHESVAASERAIALSRRFGDRLTEGHALATLGPCLAELGDVDRALDAARASIVIADEADDPDLLLRVHTNHTHVLFTTGRLEETAAVGLDAARAPGPRALITLGSAGINSVEALLVLGRWQEAEHLESLLAGRAMAVCTKDNVNAALLALRRGRFDECEALLGARNRFTPLADALQSSVRAELALLRDDPDAAAAHTDRALQGLAGLDFVLERLRASALALAALADQVARPVRRGRRGAIDPDKPRRLAAALVAEVDELLSRQAGAPSPLIAAARARCVAEAARVTGPDAGAWRQAVAAAETLGDRYGAAWCRHRTAEALLASRGERARATELLTAAWTEARELGAVPLVARCQRVAERARLKLADDEPPASPRDLVTSDLGLTPREAEVFELLALDRTDGQIADELFISKKTASVHVSNILRKLDAADRWHAGQLARDSGLAQTPDADGG